MYKDYYLPLDLYTRLKQTMRHGSKKNTDEISEFINQLPHGLKIEVSLFLHESTYKRINFFKERSSYFITWICPLLKIYRAAEKQHIFFEGDDISSIYFQKSGSCAFVLPNHMNAKFIDIPVGSYFGFIDIIGSILNKEGGMMKINEWILYKDQMRRQFTVMADQCSELLSFSIVDLNRMKTEFLDAYEIMYNESFKLLYRTLRVKLLAMKHCENIA